jgi:hypothetical protein
MDKPRKFMAKLRPDVHEWLTVAAAQRYDLHWTMNDMLVSALMYYMFLPEDTLTSDGMCACCYSPPTTGHRSTCRYSATCGGPDTA